MLKKGKLSEISGFSKLGLLLLIIFISVLILAFLGGLIAYGITNLSITSSILGDYSNPDTITYMKIMQIFQAIGIFIIPPFIAAFLFSKNKENYLQLKKTNIIWVLIAGVLMLIGLPIINWTAELNQNLVLPDSWSAIEAWMHESEASAAKITEYFLKAEGIPTLLVNLFIMALLPALGEELLFRGILQKLFIQMSKNIHIGIWITAFLFSAIHMQFFTFLPRFLMGAMFGYMLVWSGSIWLSVFAHFINNGTAVITNYLIQKGSINSDIEEVGQQNISYLIISIFLVSFGMYYLNLKKIKNRL